MKRVVFIPARLASERVPGKVLETFFGLSSLFHVYERVILADVFDEVFIVSGDEKVIRECESYGAPVVRSLRAHQSGTSRVGEILETRNPNFIAFLVQADEVLIDPDDLAHFADMAAQLAVIEPSPVMINAVSALDASTDIEDTSIVKCNIATNGRIVSCFRKNPFVNEATINHARQLNGLMAFLPPMFKDLYKLFADPLEIAELEKIEQLNFIFNDFPIFSIKLPAQERSLNTPSDKLWIERRLLDPDQQRIMRCYLRTT